MGVRNGDGIITMPESWARDLVDETLAPLAAGDG